MKNHQHKTSIVAVCFLSALAVITTYLPAKADPVLLTNMPAYTNIDNIQCGPVSVAMVLGYYAQKGYTNLFTAQGNALYTQANVTGEIAQLYVCLKTTSGGTSVGNIAPGVTNYVGPRGYTFKSLLANFYTTNTLVSGVLITNTWTTLTNEIALGRPMLFYVDMDGTGNNGHLVPALGYNNTSTGQFYACYNESNNIVSWYQFHGNKNGGDGIIYTIMKTFQIIPTALSTNASLSNLVVKTGTNSVTLSPSFSSITNSYSADVANTNTSVTITPTVNQSNATVKVCGITVASGTQSIPITLNPGPNAINAVVVAQDGVTTNTYSVTVIRAAPPFVGTVIYMR